MSWTWSGAMDQVYQIQTWDNIDSAKVPTRIQYANDQPVAWGFAAKDSVTTFEWFKLLLDYENLPLGVRTSQHVQRTLARLEGWSGYQGNPVKAAMKVTRHYLARLWRHGIEMIQDQYGQTWADGASCKVVITRPAIWSQKASARTRKVAKKSILSDYSPFESVSISMISEPEAAAQAVLLAPTVRNRPDITRPNDIFLVCDAGGGTVDVISYEVQSLNPMKLTEFVEGRGDLCGAIFIDNEFECFMRLQVGPMDWDSLSSNHRERVMDREWESGIKRPFDPKKRIKWTVDIAALGRSFAFSGYDDTILHYESSILP
ncbi:uncharacterized protein BDR25DRAFT_297413 [Lindgomyces ingoldianus]|uniref:Uncharacterized protein n=1 Tax=Lindgomyces ingoldianus TaxID=673940 RepID=A0ACB6QA97_9PLEO|nr:uncharacterized protein BDR25DRAFT_297413 [Lindgomyces ingoldianus]KAF2463832.1 hypothetical protein BDR25DRAFT_297413 [Lindgomyces ingoldianus]